MIPFDFILNYNSENIDFILVIDIDFDLDLYHYFDIELEDDNFDFVLDNFDFIDFEIDYTLSASDTILPTYRKKPDDVVGFCPPYITTENCYSFGVNCNTTCDLITEDGCNLVYKHDDE